MRIYKYLRTLLINLLWVVLLSSCSTDDDFTINNSSNYLTKNVIIVVIDGSRLTESWSSNDDNIPLQRLLAQEGVFFENFYNDGVTNTLSGHTAITTSRYESITNDGTELPTYHSIFQQYLATTNLPPDKAWIIGSKGKLEALGDTKELDWRGSYTPSINTSNRDDKETLDIALQILNDDMPNLVLIQFRGPDFYGHANDWNNYIASIKSTDQYVNNLWQFIQANPFYQDNTTLLVTNDHGRHSDGISNGFISHGDNCEGCRHISLLALGPDFTANTIVSNTYGQIDIAPTVAKFLNFDWSGEGNPITELIE